LPARGEASLLKLINVDHDKIHSMTDQILQLLLAEREKLTKAIEALQGPIRRRGRPAKNAVNGATPNAAFEPAQPTKRKSPHFSAAQRRAASLRMRQMWAKKKAAAKSHSKAGSKQKKRAKAA
jgi:hypothetical protein